MRTGSLLRAAWAPLALMASLATTPHPGHAQLISPGPLAEAHAEVEGLRNCGQCHQLGRRGIAPERCLTCHESIAERLLDAEGFHATVPADSCADCHQDHLGRDFDILHLDTRAFEHRDTGYQLEGAHGEVDCRSCHSPEHIVDPLVRARRDQSASLDRTYLGLADECVACHTPDDPHGGGFGDRACATCHTPASWPEVLTFDHGATRFPLDGRHGSADCADCHGDPSQPTSTGTAEGWTPGGCSGCHATPHGRAMSSACADCHTTSGWHDLSAESLGADFQHDRTGFRLRGAHAGADCTSCHRPGRPPRAGDLFMTYRPGTASNQYPLPQAGSCGSCHVDRHAYATPPAPGMTCSSCHAEEAWRPSSFGIEEHAGVEGFPLTGAHVAIPCVLCHVDHEDADATFQLSLASTDCAACHETDERHESAFTAWACTACHGTADFAEVTFQHPAGAESDCATCHQADDPHDGQFAGRSCAACHGVEDFAPSLVDHDATRFPLEGAHDAAVCADCHQPPENGGAIRYRPLGTECVDCHRGNP